MTDRRSWRRFCLRGKVSLCVGASKNPTSFLLPCNIHDTSPSACARPSSPGHSSSPSFRRPRRRSSPSLPILWLVWSALSLTARDFKEVCSLLLRRDERSGLEVRTACPHAFAPVIFPTPVRPFSPDPPSLLFRGYALPGPCNSWSDPHHQLGRKLSRLSYVHV